MKRETMLEIVSAVMNKCDDRSGNMLLFAGLGCNTADEITDEILEDSDISGLLALESK